MENKITLRILALFTAVFILMSVLAACASGNKDKSGAAGDTQTQGTDTLKTTTETAVTLTTTAQTTNNTDNPPVTDDETGKKDPVTDSIGAYAADAIGSGLLKSLSGDLCMSSVFEYSTLESKYINIGTGIGDKITAVTMISYDDLEKEGETAAENLSYYFMTRSEKDKSITTAVYKNGIYYSEQTGTESDEEAVREKAALPPELADAYMPVGTLMSLLSSVDLVSADLSEIFADITVSEHSEGEAFSVCLSGVDSEAINQSIIGILNYFRDSEGNIDFSTISGQDDDLLTETEKAEAMAAEAFFNYLLGALDDNKLSYKLTVNADIDKDGFLTAMKTEFGIIIREQILIIPVKVPVFEATSELTFVNPGEDVTVEQPASPELYNERTYEELFGNAFLPF